MKSIIARSSVIIFIIALLLSLLFHLSGLLQLAYMTYQAAQQYKKDKFLSPDQHITQKDTFTLFQEPDELPLPKRTRGVEQGKLEFETFKPIATAPQPIPTEPKETLHEESVEKQIEAKPVPTAKAEDTKNLETFENTEKETTAVEQPELYNTITEFSEEKTKQKKASKTKHEKYEKKEKIKKGKHASPAVQTDPNQLVKQLIKEHKQKHIAPKNLGAGFTPSSVAAAANQSMLQKGDDVFTIDSNIVGATSEEQMQLLTYVRRMVQQIESMYRFIAPKIRFSHERLYCHITTVIDRDGKILSIEIKKTSGHRTFDEYALKGIQEAAPFSPLPKFYKKDTLKQNWNVVG